MGNEPKAAMSWVTQRVFMPSMSSVREPLHISARGVSFRCRTILPASVTISKSLVAVTTLSSDRWTDTMEPFT